MSLKKYEVMLKAIDCGSFSKAAEETGYTPSGVLQMMNSLESEIGFPLFIRTTTGISLTDYGTKLLPAIRDLINSHHNLEQNISELNGLNKGEITIGTFASISITWLPAVIKKFHVDFPNITINLIEGFTQELEEMLMEKKIDFGFFSFQPHMKFDWFPLKDDPMLLILPLNNPYSELDSFPINNLINEEIIIPSKGMEYDTMRVMNAVRNSNSYPISTVDDYAAIAMVENGLCVSIVPELVLKSRPSNVAILEFDPPQYRTLGIVAHSFATLSPAAKKFVDYAKKYIPR